MSQLAHPGRFEADSFVEHRHPYPSPTTTNSSNQPEWARGDQPPYAARQDGRTSSQGNRAPSGGSDSTRLGFPSQSNQPFPRQPSPSNAAPALPFGSPDSGDSPARGRNVAALGYDSLLGHRPSSSIGGGANEGNALQLGRPRGSEREVYRQSSPVGGGSGRNSDERLRREGSYGHTAGLPDLPYQSHRPLTSVSQHHSSSSMATTTQGDTSYFPVARQTLQERERANDSASSRFAPSTSSSSTSSAALLMSPLSPLVAPFSPATGSSVSGGLPWAIKPSSNGASSERGLPTSPPLDLRSYPQQAQQQQQQLYEQQLEQQQREEQQYLYDREGDFEDHQQTPLAQRTAQPSLVSLPPLDNRKYPNLTPLGLTGVPEYGAIPGTGDSMSSLSYLQSQQLNSAASSQFPSTMYALEDAPNGSWSATMSASDSREGGRRDYRGGGFGEAPIRPGVAPSGGGSLAGGDSSVEGNAEEISTIFVVGFPDDMQEREFQNMFVLSIGFEAATLKIPAGNGTKDRESGKSGSVSGDRTSFQDPYGGMLGNETGLEEAFGNQALDGSTSTATAAQSSLPQSLSNSNLSLASTRSTAGSPASSRKQIIGFAKFRTRTQALDARDMLSGKKVDAEKGSILKAEMAKKNLHTKRGISNELISAPPSSDPSNLSRMASSSTLNPAVLAELSRQNAVAQQISSNANSMPPSTGLQNTAAFDAFHSVPSHYPPPTRRDRETSGMSAANYPLPGATTTRLRDRQSTASEQYYEDPASPVPASAAYYSLPRQNENYPQSVVPPPLQSYQSHSRERQSTSEYAEDIGAPSSSGSPAMRSVQGGWNVKSMMQQLDEGSEEQEREQQRMAANQQMYQQQQHQSQQFQNQQLQQQMHFQQQSFGNDRQAHDPYRQPPSNQFGSGHYSNESYGADDRNYLYQQGQAMLGRGVGSLPMGSSASGSSIPRTQNPADMNAPKNTLYVGGLPAVLPSLTGPFSAVQLEDSLRNAFSRCPGFRRLCFRSKSNGPIVFVEFDDVIFATRALQEMYGNQLGGIVKGGIRLSYSKNPLGVRAGSVSNGSGSPGPLSPLSLNNPNDNVFTSSLYGHSTPNANRRPTEAIFQTHPGIDYRPTGGLNGAIGMGIAVGGGTKSPANVGGYGGERYGSTFSPFGAGYDQH